MCCFATFETSLIPSIHAMMFCIAPSIEVAKEDEVRIQPIALFAMVLIGVCSQSEVVIKEMKAKLWTFSDTKEELETRVKATKGDEHAKSAQIQDAVDALEAGRKANFKEWKSFGASVLKVSCFS